MANPLGKILAPLRARVDKFLSGGQQDDPFYLSNRTITQKLKSWLVIAVPCLALAGLVTYALLQRTATNKARSADLTPSQIANKMLPDYSKTLRLGDQSVSVEEVEVLQSPVPKLVGVVRNTSDRPVHSAGVVCELLNRGGSRLGAVSASVGEIAPHGTARFEVEIPQDDAARVIVREIRVQ